MVQKQHRKIIINKCEICGVRVKNAHSKSHINSKRHQKALRGDNDNNSTKQNVKKLKKNNKN